MALTESFPGPSGLVDTIDLRKNLAGLIVRDSSGVARAGVFPRHGNALVTARASMGVDVATFEAALVRGGGPLFIANDGTVTVPIGAPPSSNSRYDIVYAKQNESTSPLTDANNLPVLGFVSGSASSTPSLAAALALVPVGGLPLASVLVPSTATTTQSAGVVITQLFSYTAVAGAPLWVRNMTELTAANLSDGALGYLLDKRWLGQRISGAWQAVGGILPFAEAGIVSVNGLETNKWVSLALSDPSGSSSDISWSSGQAGRLVPNVKGRYRLHADCIFTAVADGRLRFLVGGLSPLAETSGVIVAGAVRTEANTELSLSVGSYVEVQLLTDNGTTLYQGRVTMSYIGAAP